MPDTVSPREQALWAALHDPQGWSWDPHTSRLIHKNTSALVVEYNPHQADLAGEYQCFLRPDCTGIENPFGAGPDSDLIDYILIALRLQAPSMTLDLWQQLLVPLHLGHADRVAQMMRCMILRHASHAHGRWNARWNATESFFVLSPAEDNVQNNPFNVVIPAPSWMTASRVPFPRQITARLDSFVKIQFLMHQPIVLGTSAHLRLEDLRHASQMPDIQDPAFSVYWGLA